MLNTRTLTLKLFFNLLFIKSVSRRGIAIVIEFKIANDIDDLEKKADEAIEQIEDMIWNLEVKVIKIFSNLG